MGDAPLIVGVSGLRGIVGESLTPEVTVRFAGAFGGWLRERTGGEKWPYVLIARDGRAGGEAIYYAAISALVAAGCQVCELGVATTPTVGVLCDAKEADAAIIVTASHNPQQWNGLKVLIRRASWEGRTDGRMDVIEATPDACAPDLTTAREIVSAFEGGAVAWDAAEDLVETTSDSDVVDPHCLRVLDACSAAFGVEYFWDVFSDRPMRVVTDAVNCSAGKLNRVMFTDTPIHAVHLYSESSGLFPHTPEPTAENLSGEGGLCDAVPGLKADVGFAQDPDADRLAIVDEKGRYIGEEYTLVIAAEALLEARAHGGTVARSEKPVIVVNLSTSRMIDDVAAKWGAEVVRTPVGEANVVERMKALMAEGREVVLGGEGNGGVIWPEVCFVRDSLSAMALTLSLMARTGLTVSGLVERIDSYSGGGKGGKGYCIVKRKTGIATKADAKPACDAVEKAYSSERVDTQDGVRVDFSGARAGSWVHVRASNTEPIMRLICEAPTEGLAGEILEEVEEVIAGGG